MMVDVLTIWMWKFQPASQLPLLASRQLRCIAMVAAAVAMFGCTQQDSEDPSPSQEDRVASTKIERGPVIVMVEVAPEPARLSDEPTLTITVDHEQGVDVKMPPFGEAMGEFIIRDFYEPLPETRDQRRIIQQVYTLEPTSTGSLQIDPITISFTDARPTGDGQEHTIETEALPVNVLSVVSSEAPSLDDLEDFAPPVDLPPSRAWVGWAIGAVVAMLLIATVLAWVLARRQVIANVKQLTPRELADQELDRLWNDVASRNDVKVFYVRLTAIIRQYIEGTTGVHAPEQTTEEFLREIGAGTLFSHDERNRLKEFLESADLVKFARAMPQSADIQNSYDRARRFVASIEDEVVA